MKIKDIDDVVKNHSFKWPGGDIENYDHVVVYNAISNSGSHKISVGYTYRNTYGRDRRRVVVWIDNYPCAEFLEADDFDVSGEVLSEIRFYDPKKASKRMCRYASDVIPERYSMFRIDSLKRRIIEKRVNDAWVIVANISDHSTMISLAAMRKYERED